MKSRLLPAVAATGLALLAFGSPAHAVFIATDNAFFTALANGTLTFTYEGFSAADTDIMRVAVGGATIFQNNTTAIGTVFNLPVISGSTTRLELDNVTVPNTWFSGTAGHSDSQVHLNGTTSFTDFNIGPPSIPISTNCAGPGGTCYLGWEDLPFPTADADFNDLTFALQFTPTTPAPEPASLSVVGAALVGMSWLARRRRKTV
jgi:hypothetical protein